MIKNNKNLRKELAGELLSVKDIALTLSVTDKTARDKINGKNDFKVAEALKIKRKYFPAMSLDYLFAIEEE